MVVVYLTHHIIRNYSNQGPFLDSCSVLWCCSTRYCCDFIYCYLLLSFRLADKKVVNINPSSTASEVRWSLCLYNGFITTLWFLNCSLKVILNWTMYRTCDKSSSSELQPCSPTETTEESRTFQRACICWKQKGFACCQVITVKWLFGWSPQGVFVCVCFGVCPCCNCMWTQTWTLTGNKAKRHNNPTLLLSFRFGLPADGSGSTPGLLIFIMYFWYERMAADEQFHLGILRTTLFLIMFQLDQFESPIKM